MAEIPFIKMHGLGNDFVIIDCREKPFNLTPEAIEIICNRRMGIGCDQLVTIHPAKEADCRVRFYNADGSESGACGNATRCVAALMMYEKEASTASIQTNAGILLADVADDGWINVNMGKAHSEWQQIPLAKQSETLHVGIEKGSLKDPVAVNVGNPHAVFFVPDAENIDLERDGSALEHHPIFPERANIGVAQVISRKEIKLRVWERGSGETMACGSGACAAVVAAVKRGLCDRTVMVELPGGELEVTYHGNDEVCLNGPVAISFAGVVNDSLWLEANGGGYA